MGGGNPDGGTGGGIIGGGPDTGGGTGAPMGGGIGGGNDAGAVDDGTPENIEMEIMLFNCTLIGVNIGTSNTH